MKTLYPNLDEFFGTYFHQDWKDDSATAVGIVERYLAEWPKEEIRAASEELRHLLAERIADEDLSAVVKGFGCFYNPHADGLTYRHWLEQVHQLLMTGQASSS